MTVAFLGPLPPPVHGFSAINQAMREKLMRAGLVYTFDRAPSRVPILALAYVINMFRWVKLLVRFLFVMSMHRPHTLYVALSGGAGQLLELPFLAVAAAYGVKIFIHHHSFAYLNQHSRVLTMCLRLTRCSTHIVLCEKMKKQLAASYHVDSSRITILSNAAFLPQHSEQRPPKKATVKEVSQSVRVGYLSNITAEKGIFEFFEVLRGANIHGIIFEAVIAGPVAAGIQEKFDHELQSQPNASYIGAVYGSRKDDFFEGIDLLLFPTRYLNEAEPVTLIEAMQAGVLVIAADRGCITGMLPTCCGAAVPLEEFQRKATSAMAQIAMLHHAARQSQRRLIVEKHRIHARQSAAKLAELIAVLSGP